LIVGIINILLKDLIDYQMKTQLSKMRRVVELRPNGECLSYTITKRWWYIKEHNYFASILIGKPAIFLYLNPDTGNVDYFVNERKCLTIDSTAIDFLKQYKGKL
jgi:hypothetical protein